MFVEFKNRITKEYIEGYFKLEKGDTYTCIHKYGDIDGFKFTDIETFLNTIYDYNIYNFFIPNIANKEIGISVIESYFNYSNYEYDSNESKLTIYLTPTGIIPYIEPFDNVILEKSAYTSSNKIQDSNNYNIYNNIAYNNQYMAYVFFTTNQRPYINVSKYPEINTTRLTINQRAQTYDFEEKEFGYTFYFGNTNCFFNVIEIEYDETENIDYIDYYSVHSLIDTSEFPNEFKKPFMFYKFYDINKMIDNIAFTRRIINASEERRNKNA